MWGEEEPPIPVTNVPFLGHDGAAPWWCRVVGGLGQDQDSRPFLYPYFYILVISHAAHTGHISIHTALNPFKSFIQPFFNFALAHTSIQMSIFLRGTKECSKGQQWFVLEKLLTPGSTVGTTLTPFNAEIYHRCCS